MALRRRREVQGDRSPSAGAEFRIAIAGPLVTRRPRRRVLACARAAAQAVGAPDAIIGVLDYLWSDQRFAAGVQHDSRRCRSTADACCARILWHRSGNFTAATMSAARVARVIAGAMIASASSIFIISTGQFAGIWLAFIGLFLMQAAQAEVSYALFRQTLGGVHVARADDDRRRTSSTRPDDRVVHRRCRRSYTATRRIRSSITAHLSAWSRCVSLLWCRSTNVATKLGPGRDGADRTGARPSPRRRHHRRPCRCCKQVPGRALVIDHGRIVGILSMADVARAIELEQIRSRTGGSGAHVARGSGYSSAYRRSSGSSVAFYAPPFVVITPGTAFDVTRDITIKGIEADKVRGQYLLTSVAVQQPNVFGLSCAPSRRAASCSPLCRDRSSRRRSGGVLRAAGGAVPGSADRRRRGRREGGGTRREAHRQGRRDHERLGRMRRRTASSKRRRDRRRRRTRHLVRGRDVANAMRVTSVRLDVFARRRP